MVRKTTTLEAKKLIAEFGSNAYAKALEAEGKARRARNTRLATFFDSVAKSIAKNNALQSANRATAHQKRGKHAAGKEGCA